MREKGVGEIVAPRGGMPRVRGGLDTPREAVRVRPETWKLLAKLRRPLLDPEGNLVAFESFDRVVRRLIEERKPDAAPRARARETLP